MTDVDTLRPDPNAESNPNVRRPWRLPARVAGIAAGAALATGLFVSGIGRDTGHDGVGPAASDPPAVGQALSLDRPVVSDAGLEDITGVRIESVSLSGGGGLVDLRFMVLDPNKAAAVHDATKPPVIVDAATGVVVNELLMGHSHTGSYRAGAEYYLIFVNPGNLVQQGGDVSVLLGNTQVEHIGVG